MRPKHISKLIALILVVAASIASTTTATPLYQKPVNFSLKTLKGQTVTSADLHGKTIVLAFGATWLPLTKTQLQGIKQISDDYARQGVVVYWVSTDSENQKSKNFASDDQIHQFAVRFGITAPVLRDPDNSFSKQLGINQLPAVVIIDRNGSMFENPLVGLDPNRDLSDQVKPILDRVLKNG